MLQFTCHLSDKVKVAVDAFFNQNVAAISESLTPDDFKAIKEIDHADPIKLSSEVITYFKTPFGDAHIKQLSSGTKSVLLVLYRIRNPQFDWIPSLDSMGLNAKGVLFDILKSYTVDFPLYCTTSGLPARIDEFACCDDKGVSGTFQDVILRMRKTEGLDEDSRFAG